MKATIQKIDLSGKIILETTLKTNTIRLSELVNGTYYMNIKLESGNLISKMFVVSR